MGLNMYAHSTTTRVTQAVDFPELPPSAEVKELHQWHKHRHLHRWMAHLYESKGGSDPDFNLSPVVLDSADLDSLELAVRAHRLPTMREFFFGQSDGTGEEDDLEFIAKARREIALGKTVFYYASF